MTNSSYIRDLLARMDSKEQLPQSGDLPSSKDSVSYQAYREAEGLNDLQLLAALEEEIRRAKKVRDFEKLSKVLSGLYANTENTRVKSLYLTLVSTAPFSDNLLMKILIDGKKARLRDFDQLAIKVIENPPKKGLAYSEAISFLGEMGSSAHIPLIGRQLDADCHGLCNPFYCAVAVGKLGDKAAIPFLKRAIERHKGSRKKFSVDIVSYSTSALGEIDDGA